MDARGNIFYGAPVLRYCSVLNENCPVHLDYDEQEKVEEDTTLEVFSCGGDGDSFEAIGIKNTNVSFDWENFTKLDLVKMCGQDNYSFVPENGKTWMCKIQEAIDKLNASRSNKEQLAVGEFGWYVGCRIAP